MFNKNKIQIKIDGMHCQHCAKKVESSLLENPNVTKVKIDLKKGIAQINFKTNNVDLSEIEKVINNLDYIYRGVTK